MLQRFPLDGPVGPTPATKESTASEALTAEAPMAEASTTDAPTTDAPTTDARTADARTVDAPTVEVPTASLAAPGGTAVGAALDELFAGAPAAAWTRSRTPYSPTLIRDGDTAFLVTRRAHTPSVKIAASTWRDLDAALRTLDEFIAAERGAGTARIAFEIGADSPHPADAAELLERAGFRALREPYASAPGTVGIGGYVLDLRDRPHPELPYYAQTTDFTCGAVTALLATNALDGAGLRGQSREDDRDAELAFWRRATNFPAIDPVGLLVELSAELPTSATASAWISTDGPLLLEGEPAGFMRDAKVLLQEESALHARRRGLEIVREWLPVTALRDRLRDGGMAIVLIDERPMHDDPTPHWVLAHAADDEVVVVQDPWINAPEGESWIDGHDLPIAWDDFDAMARWGDPAYRAVVLIDRR